MLKTIVLYNNLNCLLYYLAIISSAESNDYYLISCHLELTKRLFVSIILHVRGLHINDGSRIFQGRGEGANLFYLVIFPENCIKLKKMDRQCVPSGPLRSANAVCPINCQFNFRNRNKYHSNEFALSGSWTLNKQNNARNLISEDKNVKNDHRYHPLQ